MRDVLDCPSCGDPCDDKLQLEFAKNYEFVFNESRSLNSILMNTDCANAGIALEEFKSYYFCRHNEVSKFGDPDRGMGYRIRYWWVWIDDEKLEKWTIGPGGFFRDRSKECSKAKVKN